MNTDQARRAFQAAEAEVNEARERAEELAAERRDREEALQRLGERRRAVLAAGESPHELRDERRALEAEIEDLTEEIEALREIADARESGRDGARLDLAVAQREEVERKADAVLVNLEEAITTVRGIVENLNTLVIEHRQHNDAVLRRGGPGSTLLPFGNHSDWRGFCAALDRLRL